MGYLSGAGQVQYSPQDAQADVPSTSTGIVSGGASQAAAPSNMTATQMPNEVQQNINQYNTAASGTMGSGINQQQGMNNYYQQMQQYSPGQQSYTPWALQQASAGGMGLSGYNAGNLFGVGGSAMAGNIQAGHNLINNTNGFSYSDIQRNPYTGAVASYSNQHDYNFGSPMDKMFFNNNSTMDGNGNLNMNYGSVDAYLNRITDPLAQKWNDLSQDRFSVTNGSFDPQKAQQQMILNSMPNNKNYNFKQNSNASDPYILAWQNIAAKHGLDGDQYGLDKLRQYAHTPQYGSY